MLRAGVINMNRLQALVDQQRESGRYPSRSMRLR
jgi:Arc/MetJ-type ribon-helix-helix transcriptional regulator